MDDTKDFKIDHSPQALYLEHGVLLKKIRDDEAALLSKTKGGLYAQANVELENLRVSGQQLDLLRARMAKAGVDVPETPIPFCRSAGRCINRGRCVVNPRCDY